MRICKNGRRQPISRSLPLFIDASNEVGKRVSSVCTAVTDIFKSAAAGQLRLMGVRAGIANSEVNSPKMFCGAIWHMELNDDEEL